MSQILCVWNGYRLAYPERVEVPRSPKRKTVRIISPHSATSDNDDRMPEKFPSPSQDIGSWGFQSTTVEDVGNMEDSTPEDPFGSEPDEAAETTDDEGLDQGSKKIVGSSESKTLGSNGIMPVNPFQRTLANLEDPSEVPVKREKDRPASTLAGKPSNNTKTSLDVDAFKRLLLTGDTSALPASAPSTPPTHLNTYQGNQGDSSSNTDASSISRQSIFEPHLETYLDTPRTSHEVSLSDHEQQDLVGGSPPSSTKTGQLTPKPHHGKPVREQAPRTVSFTDPTLSFSGFETTSAVSSKESGPSSPRSPTDLNKPLPLPPSSESLERTAVLVGLSATSVPAANLPPEARELPSAQKRNPPAPPLARRHSQLRSKHAPSNPERSATIAEEKQAESTSLSGASSTMSPKPPAPPPPPRRKSAGQSTSSLDYAPPLSELSVTVAQAEQTPDRPLVKVQPPKPPPPPARTPSISSFKRPARASPGSSSTTMAPPPPPPRKRGSSQSSLTDPRNSGDYRRTSTESYRRDSTASSVNQSIPESSAEPEAKGADVLADLSALQKEVDALRGKWRREVE